MYIVYILLRYVWYIPERCVNDPCFGICVSQAVLGESFPCQKHFLCFRYWKSEVSEPQRAKLFCSHSPVDGSATGSPRGRTASCSNGAFGLKRHHVTDIQKLLERWLLCTSFHRCLVLQNALELSFHLIQTHNLLPSLWDWFIAMVKKCQECLGNLGNLEIRHYF